MVQGKPPHSFELGENMAYCRKLRDNLVPNNRQESVGMHNSTTMVEHVQ
jgi:hypothetical protein